MSPAATRYVDRAAEGASRGRCVVLPGRQYTPDGPLLFFAAEAALRHGWDVRQVWWQPAERGTVSTADEVAWVGAQLDHALADHTGPAVVVAKSLGTLAASRAAALGLAAAWLTPLLTEPDAVAPLQTYPAAQLVVSGQDDPYLDRGVLATLPGTTLVLPGDHVLRHPGGAVASAATHVDVTRAVDTWLAGLPDS